VRWHQFKPALFLAGVLGVALLLATVAREPSHRGRTLSSWLQQFSETPLDETQRRSEAQQAICAIGAKTALPFLLRLAEVQDGPLRSWIIQKNERWDIRFLKFRDALSKQQLGIAGFEALETNGSAAVPELTKLLEDTNRAFAAVRCLASIGKAAEAAVCRALTNSNPDVRRFSAAELASVTDDIDVLLARLKGPLRDPDGAVRFAAVQVLGWQTEFPDEVIPLLLNALDDPHDSVASAAIQLLRDFGTNQANVFGALSNVVAGGNARRMGWALASLRAIAPERALPMILPGLLSADPQQRAGAAHLLGEYEVATPEIVAALKSAAADSDLRVAFSAKQAMLRMRKKTRKNGASDVVMANEPRYEGKGLGEWLAKIPPDGVAPVDVQTALRQMGTNAVPALFERLVYRDSVFNLSDYEISLAAMRGFVMLGEQATSVLPKLEELINGEDERMALFAVTAASNMGTNSVAVLSSAVTNRHEDVRERASAAWQANENRAVMTRTKSLER